jgi:flavin-dependent dehydrogenase
LNVGVVGGGPAGSLLAWRLARDGARVTVFDASHPREKPCGGGVTGRALALLPPETAADPLPARRVSACRFDSGDGESFELSLAAPVAIAARADLDQWLLRQATRAGARHVAERVVELDTDGNVRTSARRESFDVVAGADGSNGLSRRTLHGPLPTSRLAMATGWYAPGDSEMAIRFTPGLKGYAWAFPRAGHVGVGICAPLASVPTRDLVGRLEADAARAWPALVDLDGKRYAHTIPSPDATEASILEAARGRVALVGDAAALADPITGEGIYSALRSAGILADELRDRQSVDGYAPRLLEELGHELILSARLHDRFYAPGFARRMVRFARRSGAIREVMADLVLGTQGYQGLKRRLLRSAPRFAWEYAKGS